MYPSKKIKLSLDTELCNQNVCGRTLLEVEKEMMKKLEQIVFNPPVTHVYKPLVYASDLHNKFILKYITGIKKEVLFLGMNPGPKGMGQNGIPFGDVNIIKDWFGITGTVEHPENELPTRKVLGLDFKQSEVSGSKLWDLVRSHCITPEVFHKHCFIYNVCPVLFFDESGKNITPQELKVRNQPGLKLFQSICRSALTEIIKKLQVEIIISIGNYAEKEAKAALKNTGLSDIKEAGTGEREEIFMKKALQYAEGALKRGEVPVGCLFILGDDIIAIGSNEANETKNATRHAEISCIDTILKQCKEEGKDYSTVFSQAEVIVTVEPCIMCASALHQLRIHSIIYGAANSRFGGCHSVLDVSTVHKDSGVRVVGGIFAEEAVKLLKLFYEGTNPNAPNPKVKKRKAETDISGI